MTLADGREVTTALYDAHLILDDEAYSITVAEAPTTPLLGTDLLGASRCSSSSRPMGPSRSILYRPPPDWASQRIHGGRFRDLCRAARCGPCGAPRDVRVANGHGHRSLIGSHMTIEGSRPFEHPAAILPEGPHL